MGLHAYLLESGWRTSLLLSLHSIHRQPRSFRISLANLGSGASVHHLLVRLLDLGHSKQPKEHVSTERLSLNYRGRLLRILCSSRQEQAIRSCAMGGVSFSPLFLRTVFSEYVLTLLITDGKARKIHYTCDLFFALSWGAITGFHSPFPWFYPFFFSCMIVHRAIRDIQKCRAKYGDAWMECEKRVPWLFIPVSYPRTKQRWVELTKYAVCHLGRR